MENENKPSDAMAVLTEKLASYEASLKQIKLMLSKLEDERAKLTQQGIETQGAIQALTDLQKLLEPAKIEPKPEANDGAK
jgi:hypothetical protein